MAETLKSTAPPVIEPPPEKSPEPPKPAAPPPKQVKPEPPKPEPAKPEPTEPPKVTKEAPQPTYPASAEPASIKVSSSPSGAEVFINAEYKGTTPVTVTGIRPGTVSLLVNKEGKARFSQKFSLKPGEKLDVGTVKLGDIFGSVSITSVPSGAKVIFDGEDIGARTPLTVKKVRRDKQHTVQVVLKGFKTWERTFEMAGDEDDKKFSVTLEEE
jgi:hypothetical protein